MLEEDIKKILEYSVWAPSGDNSQPWEFEIRDDIIRIFNLEKKDNAFLNFKQSGSYIAHGGLIENIVISSSNFGYKADVNIHDSDSDPLMASIKLKEDKDITKDELFQFIKKRHTNRKKYKNNVLEKNKKDYLFFNLIKNNFCKISIVEDFLNKKKLGWDISSAEIVILENKELHKYLFKDFVWTSRSENKKKSGLFLKTMEFNIIQKFLFFLASKWNLMRIAKKIKFPLFVAKQDSKLYSSGSFIGLISIKDDSKKSFIESGRMMQRIWLKSTKLGLSFQPLTATLFLGRRVLFNKTRSLSEKHLKIISSSYNSICDIFKVSKDEIPVILFRVGYSKPTSARCSRINISEKII